jgi:ankyrin repeat protein
MVWAAALNLVNVMAVFIERSNAGIYNNMPLQTAVHYDRLEMVDFLARNGADVNAQNGAFLTEATHRNNTEMVRVLLKVRIVERMGLH